MSQAASVLFYRSFAIPKEGNNRDEYEDAFAGDDVKGRFALADGASESIYAGEWAALLCDAFVADPAAAENIPNWRAHLQNKWLGLVDHKAAQPWYVQEKLQDGAFATFLGLLIDEAAAGDPYAWRAWAVGDSCLFQIHDDALKLAFPVEKSVEFDTRPELIGSRQRSPVTAIPASGALAPGDCLLLMTDALAHWFLEQHEAGRKPWHELLGLTNETFPAWVDSQRRQRCVKNDDMTLLTIQAQAATT